MKEKIKVFKTIWSNPIYKTLIFFGFYFVFFLVIYLMSVGYSSNSKVVIKKSNEDKKINFYNLNNYDFTININNENINGSFNDNIITLTYQNINYTYENDIITPDDFLYLDILPFLNNKNLYNLLNDKKYYSKTEYQNGTLLKEYHIDDMVISTLEDTDLKQINVIINNNNYLIDYEY